ncbi:hypothetical protein FCQ88_005197 [Escherichia coli]|nr:hypothetical protein [Escherichia coli]
MNKEKSPDYFVKRLQDATESMLIALNNYSYEEAVTVLEWIKEKITEDSIVKMQSINISRDKTFPLRTPPKRRLVYSIPVLMQCKLPK